jgi:hypothetical protein
MSTYIRTLLVSAVCLGLLVLASVRFPVSSDAKPQVPQEINSQKRQRQQNFVPGEVLVQYRSESMARNKGAGMRIAALDGRILPVDVERTHGSDLLPGLRLAHVAP